MNTPPARSIASMGDHPRAIHFTARSYRPAARADRQGRSQLQFDGQRRLGRLGAGAGKLVGAGSANAALRARSTPSPTIQCKDGRWLILSPLNEDRQYPRYALPGREDLIAIQIETKQERHAPLELIKIFDESLQPGPCRGARSSTATAWCSASSASSMT
jgi:formyl-CoA transferase